MSSLKDFKTPTSSFMQYGNSTYIDGVKVASVSGNSSFSPTFRPASNPQVSNLASSMSRLGLIGSLVGVVTTPVVDYAKFAYVKKLLQNPNWVPSDNLRISNPEEYNYAMTVINNRKIEAQNALLAQQQKEYDENVANHIDFAGGYDNLSDDDIGNIMRANLENYPELKEVIGNKIPSYSTPEPVLPIGPNGEPYSPAPPSGTTPTPVAPTPVAPTLLSVLIDTNNKLVNSLNVHADKVSSAIRGEPYVPTVPPETEPEPVDPFSTSPDKSPVVGVPFKDENGVMMVLGDDGIMRITSNTYNHSEYQKDMERVLSARLSPRPVAGYENPSFPHTPEYLARVAQAQSEYDARYGTPDELASLMDKYRVTDSDISGVLRTSNIPSPVAPVVSGYGSTVSSSAPVVNVSSSAPVVNVEIPDNILVDINRSDNELALTAKQLEIAQFDTTEIQLGNLGDEIPKTTPQMMRAIKDAVVAKKNSDENTFQIDETDIDDFFGVGIPDISSIFDFSSKTSRLQEVSDSL